MTASLGKYAQFFEPYLVADETMGIGSLACCSKSDEWAGKVLDS